MPCNLFRLEWPPVRSEWEFVVDSKCPERSGKAIWNDGRSSLLHPETTIIRTLAGAEKAAAGNRPVQSAGYAASEPGAALSGKLAAALISVNSLNHTRKEAMPSPNVYRSDLTGRHRAAAFP